MIIFRTSWSRSFFENYLHVVVFVELLGRLYLGFRGCFLFLTLAAAFVFLLAFIFFIFLLRHFFLFFLLIVFLLLRSLGIYFIVFAQLFKEMPHKGANLEKKSEAVVN